MLLWTYSVFNTEQLQQHTSMTEAVAVMPFLRSHLLRFIVHNLLSF